MLGGIWPQADTRPRGFLALLILLLPVTALVVLYTPPFEVWRQARAEQLIDDAIISRPPSALQCEWVSASSPPSRFPTFKAEDDLPRDMDAISAKTLSLKISVLPLLMGRLQLNSMVVDGLKIDIEIPVQTDEGATGTR